MFSYILRRLLLMIPTLIGITLMLFLMARFAPGLTGGGAFGEGGARANREDRERAILEMYRKLDMVDEHDHMLPLYQQYARWLWHACHLEFGRSVKYGEKVSTLLLDKLPVTVTMNIIEAFLVYLVAIPGGMLAAVRRGKYFDVGWGVGTIALFSIPVILSGNLAIYYLANPQHLAWFPPGQLHSLDVATAGFWVYTRDYLWHLVLPVFVMCLGGFAYTSKMMRASLLDNLSLDYVRTARAKGVGPARVISHHVLRNSLLPMITIFAQVLPALLGGSVIIESIFSIPGMGQLGLTATLSRDLPILQAVTFMGAIISMLCYLLQDICYAIADPRVSYD
jgi:ABC-type dipeptide/oligopeptide/nickel transport system permease component